MEGLINLFFNIFETQIKNWFYDGLSFSVKLSTLLTNKFWDQPVIDVVMVFIQTVANIVLACSLIVMLFDIAEEGAGFKTIPWGTVIGNFLKAVIYTNTFIWFGKTITTLVGDITAHLPLTDFVLDEPDVVNLITGYSELSFLVTLIIICFLQVAYVVFTFMMVLRFTNMFIHIIGGLYYISDIIRGDTSAIGSWLRQAIVISCTYAIQYLMFTIGSALLIDSGATIGSDFILGIAMLIGMFFVPKILQKYGMSTGVTGVLSQAGNVLSSGRSLVGA